MPTKLREVDAVIVGLGWTGGILAKELCEAGLKVVALERGSPRTTQEDFQVPQVRDELRYVSRNELIMNVQRDTLTIRNDPSQEALPMRRLGSFLPGEGVGGSGVHWSGHTWRWGDDELRIRSRYEERYGKRYIPEDMTLQDWAITRSRARARTPRAPIPIPTARSSAPASTAATARSSAARRTRRAARTSPSSRRR